MRSTIDRKITIDNYITCSLTKKCRLYIYYFMWRYKKWPEHPWNVPKRAKNMESLLFSRINDQYGGWTGKGNKM